MTSKGIGNKSILSLPKKNARVRKEKILRSTDLCVARHYSLHEDEHAHALTKLELLLHLT